MTPQIGSVRGIFGVPESVVGKTYVLVYDSVTAPTTSHSKSSNSKSSTPVNACPDNVTQYLLNLIGELGNQIGDSIVSHC